MFPQLTMYGYRLSSCVFHTVVVQVTQTLSKQPKGQRDRWQRVQIWRLSL